MISSSRVKKRHHDSPVGVFQNVFFDLFDQIRISTDLSRRIPDLGLSHRIDGRNDGFWEEVSILETGLVDSDHNENEQDEDYA